MMVDTRGPCGRHAWLLPGPLAGGPLGEKSGRRSDATLDDLSLQLCSRRSRVVVFVSLRVAFVSLRAYGLRAGKGRHGTYL